MGTCAPSKMRIPLAGVTKVAGPKAGGVECLGTVLHRAFLLASKGFFVSVVRRSCAVQGTFYFRHSQVRVPHLNRVRDVRRRVQVRPDVRAAVQLFGHDAHVPGSGHECGGAHQFLHE